MKTYLCISDRQVALEDHLSKARTLIPLGRKSEEAYNVLALEDTALDTFQCQFSCTEAGWKINDGQWRTDCPKGILSRLQHACNLCMGIICYVPIKPAACKKNTAVPKTDKIPFADASDLFLRFQELYNPAQHTASSLIRSC